jgi:hypothetical protein
LAIVLQKSENPHPKRQISQVGAYNYLHHHPSYSLPRCHPCGTVVAEGICKQRKINYGQWLQTKITPSKQLEFMVKKLPKIKIENKICYIDKRLSETRDVNNPHDAETVSPEVIDYWLKHNIKKL